MVYVWNGLMWEDYWYCEVYIFIYKGYRFVGFLIISYYYDMRVIYGLIW